MKVSREGGNTLSPAVKPECVKNGRFYAWRRQSKKEKTTRKCGLFLLNKTDYSFCIIGGRIRRAYRNKTAYALPINRRLQSRKY